MKNFTKIIFALFIAVILVSCEKDNEIDSYKTYEVAVKILYPDNSLATDIKVKLVNPLSSSSDSYMESSTNDAGIATFNVPAGIYEASSSVVKSENGYSFIYNGVLSNITVTSAWITTDIQTITLTESKSGQIIIKELYVGGCPKDDGSGVMQTDKYVILYNNSDLDASIDNLCLGMALPYNSHATNNAYIDGKLEYDSEGWIPAGVGIWYFPSDMIIPARQQIVIALNGAINHTETYSNSVDLSKSEYYCTYDIAVYPNTTYYPAPSSNIPTSNYFSAIHYGTGNAWALSTICPAFFIFRTEGVSPADFANNTDNNYYHGGNASAVNLCKKVPNEWILDAVEVYTTTSDKNQKRFTSTIDAGYVYLQNKFGYTLYRNVDKEATEAIAENDGKLVYSYSFGQDSTDPSNIDAEASINNGAKIVYRDSNNSSNDFHQRSKSSLKN